MWCHFQSDPGLYPVLGRLSELKVRELSVRGVRLYSTATPDNREQTSREMSSIESSNDARQNSRRPQRNASAFADAIGEPDGFRDLCKARIGLRAPECFASR